MTSWWCFWRSYINLHKIRSRQLRDFKLGGMIAYIQFYKIWDFQITTTWNDVIIVFFLICLENLPKTSCSFETLPADSPSKVLQMCKFESHVTRNDVIMMSLPKTMENNLKIRTSGEPNKIYIVGKVLMRAIQKCNFYWIWAFVSKVMGIYVKFTKTTHPIWSCHVTLASNFEDFYFSPNSVLNFRKSYQIWGKLA